MTDLTALAEKLDAGAKAGRNMSLRITPQVAAELVEAIRFAKLASGIDPENVEPYGAQNHEAGQ